MLFQPSKSFTESWRPTEAAGVHLETGFSSRAPKGSVVSVLAGDVAGAAALFPPWANAEGA
jgi:hypothetical protein